MGKGPPPEPVRKTRRLKDCPFKQGECTGKSCTAFTVILPAYQSEPEPYCRAFRGTIYERKTDTI